jgi:flagellar secretion chaperone FliS
MTNRSAERYRNQEILTATPCQLVVKLYDKAIASLAQAEEAIGRRDIKARHAANIRTLEIVSHLTNTLDLERGGEIARNLSRLYGFMCMRMLDIDLNNDAQAARDVIGLLQPLRTSWSELDLKLAASRLATVRPVTDPPGASRASPSAPAPVPARVFASA